MKTGWEGARKEDREREREVFDPVTILDLSHMIDKFSHP